LDGVEAAYFTYPIGAGVVDAVATFAAAARQLGGRQRIVVMSMGASHPDSPSHLGRAQWLAEEVLAWAGLDLLVLRVAALFHENLTMLHSQSIRDEGAFRNCFGDAAVPWINGEDAAALAAAALLHPGRFSGDAIHYPPGSELLSHAAVAALLGEELGRPVHFEPVARESWSDELVALAAAEPDSGVNADMAGHISAVGAMLAAPGRRPIQAPNADELGRLTGRPPISLRAFLHRERGRFDRLERLMEVGREPAGSSRPETRSWCLELGAHHVVDHAGDLPGQLRALDLPHGEYVFSTTATDAHWPAIAEIVAPQGKVGVIDDPEAFDVRLLKGKSASLHWELMFTRSTYGTADMQAQHDLLCEVADLVDAGTLRTTLAETLGPINAATLRRAHALLESGRARGKLVLTGF